MKRKIFMLALIAMLAIGCRSVSQTEKWYINDGEMILSLKKIEKMELNFQLYREGASGATGGKSGGGCGCN